MENVQSCTLTEEDDQEEKDVNTMSLIGEPGYTWVNAKI